MPTKKQTTACELSRRPDVNQLCRVYIPKPSKYYQTRGCFFSCSTLRLMTAIATGHAIVATSARPASTTALFICASVFAVSYNLTRSDKSSVHPITAHVSNKP